MLCPIGDHLRGQLSRKVHSQYINLQQTLLFICRFKKGEVVADAHTTAFPEIVADFFRTVVDGLC